MARQHAMIVRSRPMPHLKVAGKPTRDEAEWAAVAKLAACIALVEAIAHARLHAPDLSVSIPFTLLVHKEKTAREPSTSIDSAQLTRQQSVLYGAQPSPSIGFLFRRATIACGAGMRSATDTPRSAASDNS
eukprot:SAG11_NODE_924_length_6525_cov_5.604264_5_plen_131_part_00